MPPRTSSSDPIRVDYLPVSALPLPGRLGLTLAPGKHAPGAHGSWARELDVDLDRLLAVYATAHLVSLAEDAELARLRVPSLAAAAHARGLVLTRFPIPDGGVPDLARTVELVASILDGARTPANAVLHCGDGLGRAGTIAACTLAAAGHAPRDALRIVRAARPGAVETAEQERFVVSFAEAWIRAIAARVVAPVRLGPRRPGAPPLSAFRGALLGGAIGDALGFPLASADSTSAVVARHGGRAPKDLLALPGDAPRISDDTQMTLFTAEGVVRGLQRHAERGVASIPDCVGRALLRWYATQLGAPVEGAEPAGWLSRDARLAARRAPGATCLAALNAISAGRPAGSVESPPNGSRGCGAVVRSAPIGLAAASRELAFATARDAAALTHGHPSGYLSAACFAALIFDVARGKELADAIELALPLLSSERGHEETARALLRARSLATGLVPSPAVLATFGEGSAGDEALGIAVLCALAADTSSAEGIAEAIWRAVAYGGDGDGTGSLTGNLLGAMVGVEELPPRWLEQVELRDAIDRLACDLYATSVLGTVLDFESYPPS